MCHLAIREMCLAFRHDGQARVSHGLQTLLLATALLACIPACFAERADRDKPLSLEADQVLIDDMLQTSTFTGNVRLTQGTMLILGDRIEVVKHKDGFNYPILDGNTDTYVFNLNLLEE